MTGEASRGPLAFSVHGCRTEADLGLAIGSALGVAPVGAAGALRARLAAPLPPLRLRGLAADPEVRARVAALLDGLDWAPAPREGGAGHENADLEGFVAGLPGAPGPGRIETAPGRVAGRGTGPTTPESRAHARATLAAVLRVADGAPPPAGLAWPELLALDQLAAEDPAPARRAQARAAAARLRVRWGQPAAAQARLDAAGRDPGQVGAPALARIDRARAVVALHLGHRGAWQRALAAARQRLGPGATAESRAVLAMERGAGLLDAWHAPEPAAEAFALAQLHWRDAGDAGGRIRALIGEGRALVATGRPLPARARLAEAVALGAAPELVAPLQLALGARLAGPPGGPPGGPAEQRGARALVVAEQAAARGEAEAAQAAGEVALAAWRAVSRAAGVGAAQRVLGDAAALAGAEAAADAWYRAALATFAAVHDRPGVGTTVAHARRALGPGRRAGWEEIAALLAPGDETTASRGGRCAPAGA